MGLSIHYKGRIDDKTKVHQLMDEIQDIAQTMNWTYHRLNEDWKKESNVKLEHDSQGNAYIKGHAGLKGISFSPHPKSETIWLFFDCEGRINSPLNLIMEDDYSDSGWKHWLSVKTQHAGADTHIAIITLFQYLKKKYVSNLEVNDEGAYWETGSREQLETKINHINATIDMLTDALSNLPEESDDNAESIVRKVEKLLKDLGFEQSPE